MNVDTFGRVARAVSEHLTRRQPAPSSREVAVLRALAQADEPIDYDLSAFTFASSYWERNFWKAAYFLAYEYVRPSTLVSRLSESSSALDVIVLGAGSAADTVALLAWVNDTMPLQKVTVTLLDRSQGQLALAREVIEVALVQLDQAVVDVRYQRLDASEWQPIRNSADMVMMSHFLTENTAATDALVAKVLDVLRSRGDVIIIERQRDPVWERARDRLARNGVPVQSVGISPDKFPLFSPFLPEKERDMEPSYVRGCMPEVPRLRELVRDYFGAWEGQSTEALDRIFTPSAIYDEKPGIEPAMCGLDEIRRYWDAHPVQQRGIRLRIENVGYGPTVAVCQFQVSFDTRKQHIDLDGVFTFEFDSYLARFNRLSERFKTVKTPFSH